MGLYAPREYLKLLEPIDVFEKETKKHLAFSNDAINKVLPIIGENTLNVVIAPGAGNKVKEWPTERFTEIADYLIDKYKAKVFLIGNDNDHELSKTLISDVKNKNVIVDLCGKLSIDELKAFISRMNLFISVDTGPIYIAEAFDIPTIDIVGPMDENEQPPMSEKHIVVLPSQREKPMMHIMNAREFNYEEARRQILSI
jgi:ADP-heptose:LPS heptosyltransferase